MRSFGGAPSVVPQGVTVAAAASALRAALVPMAEGHLAAAAKVGATAEGGALFGAEEGGLDDDGSGGGQEEVLCDVLSYALALAGAFEESAALPSSRCWGTTLADLSSSVLNMGHFSA